jgi:negative regulator of flagellin synthesis FlgM
MQISGQGRSQDLARLLLGVQEADRPAAKSSSEAGHKADQVQISEQAKEIQRITALAQEPDPDRTAFVERIRQAVQDGTYRLDSKATADAVIRHALTDAVL